MDADPFDSRRISKTTQSRQFDRDMNARSMSSDVEVILNFSSVSVNATARSIFTRSARDYVQLTGEPSVCS